MWNLFFFFDFPPLSLDDIDILALSDWSDGAARGNSAFHPWFLSPVAIDRKYRKHVRFLLGFFKEGTHMPNASHVLCALLSPFFLQEVQYDVR